MNILVSGISGFLGRHVAAEVVKRGHNLVRRQFDLLSEFTPGQRAMMGPVDAVIHCAAICRWSPKPNSDGRFGKNLDMCGNLLGLLPLLSTVVLPMPHGALDPWNAYSCAADSIVSTYARDSLRPVYLPTLYGEGDPHHAKAIPSFLLCATGRGESQPVIYGGGHQRRHYMHVEEAAKRLVQAVGDPGIVSPVVHGEIASIEGLETMVRRIAYEVGRKVPLPEHRPWQFRADGLGSPSPDLVGPPEPGPTERRLEEWLYATIKKRLEALAEEQRKRAEEEAKAFAGPSGSDGPDFSL